MRSSDVDRSSSDGRRSSRTGRTPSGLKYLTGLTVLAALVAGISGIASLVGAQGGSADGVIGLISIGAAVGLCCLAYGLWTVEPWAWRWGLALYGLLTLANILSGNILTVFFLLGVLVYLIYVRYDFRRTRHSRAR